MAFRSLTVEEFADMLAAKTPAPGGGAVAAVTASHAAALGAMVLEFTIGKPKFAISEESNASALRRLTFGRNAITLAAFMGFAGSISNHSRVMSDSRMMSL